ncbi:MAG: hypothetical protein O7H41_15870 [Planctomycetota bacterium]|nr:hypothetical protein [Planctomycetota bacterium]
MIPVGRLALGILLMIVPAPPDDDRTPRERYNAALEALELGEIDAAEEGFADARDRAGPDPELRFRSSYNLGMTFGARADEVDPEDAEGVIEALRQSAAWFRDTVRLRPGDADARTNLELVLRRIQALADRMNQGRNSLEARLDRLIEDQRSLRDSIRNLILQVQAAGASAEPIGKEEAFRSAASWQRTLLADADSLAGSAGNELGALQSKAEEERTDADRVRMAQLGNLDFHLRPARERMADARVVLRKLQGESAHRKADEALRRLKRAREQLLDPVTVLRSILQDQVVILSGADALARAEAPVIGTGMEDEPAAPPAWLHPGYLHDLQESARQRTGEVHLRFEAATSEGPTEEAEDVPEDRQTRRLLQAATEAVPHLRAALNSMAGSSVAFKGERPAESIPHQREALLALARAIERFSGIRELIEIVHADQHVMVALLTPPGDDDEDPSLQEEMTTEERAGRIDESVRRNVERLGRLKTLFEDEVASIEESVPDGAPDEDDAEEARRRIEQQRDLFRLGEVERSGAAEALGRVDVKDEDRAEGHLAAATEALDHIKALRRLFYSIVEHLEELIREQSETHDRSGSAAAELDQEKRGVLLGPLGEAQGRHETKALTIASALQEQSEHGAGTPAPSGQDPSARFAQAAEEITKAADAMFEAGGEIKRDDAEMEAALDHQKRALEHLATALALLKPPEPSQQQDQQQEQDQQQISREQAARRLQEVREREADRRRQKDARRSASESVEKDW